MSLSIQKMVSDGTLSTIVLGVQYLQRNDVYLRIAGVETPQSGAPSGYTWSFLDNNTIRVLPVVPAGVEVVVYRRTDLDEMYNVYSQNAQFDESTIDENNQQLLFIAQEYFEQGIPAQLITSVEYTHEDTVSMYYRLKLSDGSYTAEFAIPKGGAAGFEALRRTYAEAGLTLVDGSFETGGTLSSSTDVLLLNVTAKAYAWAGALPKVVAPGTDPATVAGFVMRSDAGLRSELSVVDGAGLIGGATYAQIRAYTGSATKISCIGRVNVFDGASGYFALDSSDTTSSDNDVTVLVDAAGRRWKRQYSGMIQPEWAGALRYPSSADCTSAIQKCLALGPTEIAADYYIAGTIEINEGQSLIFTGGQLLQKTNATTSIRVNYGGEARDVLVNTSAVDMDGSAPVPVIEVAPWSHPTKMKQTKVTGHIIGNFPQLQGIGVRLYAKTTSAEQTYSLIQFAHVDVTVYGLRDALVIDVTQFATDDIVYVTSSYIKVYSKNCYRPVQLINNAALAQITSGNCGIADNDFILGGQAYVGSEVFCHADGCTGNRFVIAPSDWNAAFWINLTAKSFDNTVDGSIPVANTAKINDASGKNRVKRREAIAAKVLFNGITGEMSYANGGTVTKLATGSYQFSFNSPFSNANSYVATAQGSTNSVNTIVPILISPTASKTADYIIFSCYRADTGAAIDIPAISFMAVGQ